MSKPIVVIVCMARSSESWEPQQLPHPWHRCAGGGAVHSINFGHGLAQRKLTLCANTGHELAYSITSTAPTSTDGGNVRPSALAVLMLMAKSRWVGPWNGNSLARSPLRIR